MLVLSFQNESQAGSLTLAHIVLGLSIIIKQRVHRRWHVNLWADQSNFCVRPVVGLFCLFIMVFNELDSSMFLALLKVNVPFMVV